MSETEVTGVETEVTLESQARSINENDAQQPHMPREDTLGEARKLAIAVSNDRERFEARGISAEEIDIYPQKIELYANASSAFVTSLFDKSEHRLNWDEIEPEAYRFKWDMLDELEFSLRNNPSELKYVKKIRAGRGRRDLVCDYRDSVTLIGKNRTILEEAFFDFSIEQQAKDDMEILADLLSKMETSPELVDEHKIFCYQAYTLLNESTQKFRDFGQHIFRNDPEKLDQYKSDHFQKIGGTRAEDELETIE